MTPDKVIWSCPIGDSCKYWGSRQVYKFFSQKSYQTVVKTKERVKMASPSLFPESSSLAFRYVADLKPVPQAEALGQVNMPYSQEDCGCVSVCCLCRVLGWPATKCLSDCFSSVGSRNTNLTSHQSQDSKGIPCRECMCLPGLARKSENAGSGHTCKF